MEVNKYKIIKSGIKCFVISIILTLVSIFILAAFLCYSNVSERIIDVALILISAISILLGTVLYGKNIKEKGLMHGGFFGILYMLSLFLISSFVSADFSIEIGTGIMIVFGCVAGCIGGIIGVNLGKWKSK